ncbi:multiple sugar transport system permease protein [Actinoalloteichus hoggarensis]|uniref:Lactose transport system permease protein LacF n=1 Tax=Actinoalloteichus hoggarensis TaxID=1470176 RepID=A0A221W916_9PSEU|nr:sugar ABC transporter permease [Actinoalloteichus hoggarensis]ASO22029.1 Lactose transport system permease protein LacF [Actinoalloteichus hoggarensis]MBB5923890.1 multiple sugar transport system permease protein [Actinoalloteichus hoggarensis]
MTVLAKSETSAEPRPPGPRRRRLRTAPLVLAAPFALLLTGTVLIPIGYALYLSLFTERLTGLGFAGPEDVFVWLANYAEVLGDPAFRTSLVNVGLYALIHVPLMLGAALVLALLLDGAVLRLRQMWSLMVFLPYAVPGVIAGLIWSYLFSPGIGPLNDVLPWNPLGADGVLPSIVVMATWQWMGYNMIIFYTALQTVPRDVLEAARVDGAGPIRTALSIKTPMIRPTIFVALVFTVIGSLQLFTEPLVLSSFTNSVTSTWTPSLYVYESAFISNDYGKAAAASLVLAVASAILSALVMRLSTRRSR